MSETPSDTQVHLRKTRVGVVISNKMDKTLVVEHVARVPHPKFNKIVKRSKKYYVHDESNQGQIGDRGGDRRGNGGGDRGGDRRPNPRN